MMKKTILAVIFAASLGSVATLASAAIIVQSAPPPPRVEVVPEHRPGHVWNEGHWGWKNRHHQWVKGTWIRERSGYHYNQPAWVERNGRWQFTNGNWRRGDRDGDGVPNRMDRAPDNPNRN
jgi:WXXGXW repeat (2 copies)